MPHTSSIWAFFAKHAEPEVQEWFFDHYPQAQHALASNPQLSLEMFEKLYLLARGTKDTALETTLLDRELPDSHLNYLFQNVSWQHAFKKVLRKNPLTTDQLVTWAHSPRFSKALARFVTEKHYATHRPAPSEEWLRAAQDKLSGFGKLLLWVTAPDVISDDELSDAFLNTEQWDGNIIYTNVTPAAKLFIHRLLDTRPGLIKAAARSSSYLIRECAAASRQLSTEEDQLALLDAEFQGRPVPPPSTIHILVSNPVVTDEAAKIAYNHHNPLLSSSPATTAALEGRRGQFTDPFNELKDPAQIDTVIQRISKFPELLGDAEPLLANPHVTDGQKEMLLIYLESAFPFAVPEVDPTASAHDRLQDYVSALLPPFQPEKSTQKPQAAPKPAVQAADILRLGWGGAMKREVFRDDALKIVAASFGSNIELWKVAGTLGLTFDGTVEDFISTAHAIVGAPSAPDLVLQ